VCTCSVSDVRENRKYVSVRESACVCAYERMSMCV